MYNDAAMQTQTHKHSHWDVVPVKETNKRMQPNEIGWIMEQKKGIAIHKQKHSHWNHAQAREKNKRMHPNDIKKIMLQKE